MDTIDSETAPMTPTQAPRTPSSRMRHTLSPAERWNQLRRAKDTTRALMPRRKRSRATLVCLFALPVVTILFVLLMLRRRGDGLPTTGPTYARRLPSYESVTGNFTAPSLRILGADSPKDASVTRKEFLAIYRPLLFVRRTGEVVRAGETGSAESHTVAATLRGDPHQLTGRRLIQCVTFDGGVSHRGSECLQHARTLAVQKSTLSYDAITANARAGDGHGLTCTNKSVIVIPLSKEDSDLRYLLPRLMMGYAALQRAKYTTRWLGIPPVQAIVLVASPIHVFQLLRPGAGTIHSSLAHALLTRDYVDVAVVRSVRELTKSCFAAGIVVGGLHDRLAIPDSAIGNDGGYLGTLPRENPLSSDALALRKVVLGKEKAEIKMRNKLLFVLDEGSSNEDGGSASGSGSLSPSATYAVRSGLRAISKREGIELAVLDVAAERLPFAQLAEKFADVSVVVGVHSNTMALCMFLPPGASVVEMAPRKIESARKLYAGLDAAGVDYVHVALAAKGTPYNLANVELETLLHFVEERVQKGKQRTAQNVGDIVLQ